MAKAIHTSITDLRLALIRGKHHEASSEADFLIAQVEIPLYRAIKAALTVSDRKTV